MKYLRFILEEDLELRRGILIRIAGENTRLAVVMELAGFGEMRLPGQEFRKDVVPGGGRVGIDSAEVYLVESRLEIDDGVPVAPKARVLAAGEAERINARPAKEHILPSAA